MNNDQKKSDLLDMSDAKTLSESDKDALKSAPRAGNSSHPTGVAGVVMSDESYVGRGESPGLDNAENDSGVLTQTVNSGEIEAAQSSETGNETDISGVSNLEESADVPAELNKYNE
ncbi:MAG TPA: hypothetical protein VF599_01035 [Pyrinomonadaceae bacterium]|jgi:hypothetical protein